MALTVPTPGIDRNIKVLNPIYVFNENFSELEYFYLGREALTRDYEKHIIFFMSFIY